MPKRPSKNVIPKMIEFPSEQAEEVQKFADSRGETFRAVVLHALRRHLKYPPPPPESEPTEPLPDSPSSAPARQSVGTPARKSCQPRKVNSRGD